MKIDGIGVVAVPTVDKGKKNEKKGKADKAAGKSSNATAESAGDSVEVGSHSETLQVIRDLVAQNPDIRMDEVDRITRQLKGGKYKINFERVAEGFIKEAILTEMSKRPRKK